MAKDVLAIKAEFLRSKSLSDSVAEAHFNAKSNNGLAPKIVFDTSADITPPMPSDASDEDVDAAMDVDPKPASKKIEPYISIDAEILSTAATGVFPCTIRYMDLTGLGLEYPIRIPKLTLLRNEWHSMVDIFNKRQPGLQGSAIFTGQPGIGEHCP